MAMLATDMKQRLLLGTVALLLCGLVGSAYGAAGEVEFVRGVATLQKAGKPDAILAQGTKLEEGDTVSTSSGSFAVLQMADGTKMTVRPDTRMQIQTFIFKPEAAPDASAGSMVFNLIKGGLRTITGIIPKRSTTAAQVHTPTATVGIRGTDFDVRLCTTDCAKEQVAQAGTEPKKNVIAASARVVRLDGNASVTATDGTHRLLALGGPLYPGDTIETTTGYVVVVFRDQSKVTVQPGTRLKVEDFVYDQQHPEEGRFFVSLLKGGLRAFTGLIGSVDHSHVGYRTPTATVGIRGTGFDMLCQGTCAGENPTPTADGLTANVWDGSIALNAANSTSPPIVLATGQTGVVGTTGVQLNPQALGNLNFQTPRPDSIQADMDKLFGETDVNGNQPGLYVVVRDGHVSIETAGQVLDLGKGETGFANGTVLVRPLTVPEFLNADKIPLPNGQSLAQGLLGLIKSSGVSAQCQR
jgi:hypothetical protein